MVNRDNYHQVKAHLRFLREVKQVDSKSEGRYWFYLKHPILWLNETSFGEAKKFRPTFPDYLAAVTGPNGAEMLAPNTYKKIVNTTKRFLRWAKLAYPKEFKNITPDFIDSLRPPRCANIEGEHDHVFVTEAEVLRIAALKIDERDLASRRDQAAAALLFMSGARAGAFVSLPIKAVDIKNHEIYQWPAFGVKTKNGKSATTVLFEIPELMAVAEAWDAFVRPQLPPTAPWYAPVISQWGEQSLSSAPRGEYANIALADRLRSLFAMAGLEYRSPHKFRHGHAVYALQRADTMADYKAVSMNLMHEDIKVTDSIYAPLLINEVKERIDRLTQRSAAMPADDTDLANYLRCLSKGQKREALHILADEISR